MKAPCHVCFRTVHQCVDGTIGAHWTGFKDSRRRCPGGRQRHRAMPSGRRITVTVDLVLPVAEWDAVRARAVITTAIREHCPDLFAIDIDLQEQPS